MTRLRSRNRVTPECREQDIYDSVRSSSCVENAAGYHRSTLALRSVHERIYTDTRVHVAVYTDRCR